MNYCRIPVMGASGPIQGSREVNSCQQVPDETVGSKRSGI